MNKVEEQTRITMLPPAGETARVNIFDVTLSITPQIGPDYLFSEKVVTHQGGEEAVMRTMQEAERQAQTHDRPEPVDYEVIEVIRQASCISTIPRVPLFDVKIERPGPPEEA